MNFFAGIDFCMGGYSPEYRMTNSHVPTYYGVQYNHAGQVRLSIDNQKEYQETGAWAFITHPGAFFDYGSVEHQPREHHYICFRGSRVQQYINSGLLPMDKETPLIRINHPDKFRQTMVELTKAINSDRFRHDRMVLMLEDLLLQLDEQDDHDKKLPARQTPHFIRLVEAIGKNPQRCWDFDQEAAAINVTSIHFCRLFKQFCGQPPQQYLLLRRLRLAADLLVNSSSSVSDIAERVGFADIFYFSRVFKRKYAVSPIAYRKEFVGK